MPNLLQRGVLVFANCSFYLIQKRVSLKHLNKKFLIAFALVALSFARVTSDVMYQEEGAAYEYRQEQNDSVLFVDSLGSWRTDTVIGWDLNTLWHIKDIVAYRKFGNQIDSNFAWYAPHKGDSSTYLGVDNVLVYDSLGMRFAVYNSGERSSAQFTADSLKGRRFVISFYYSSLGADTSDVVPNMRHDGAGYDRTLVPSVVGEKHLRKSQKCGARGYYKMTFVEGIGPVRVSYDSCVNHSIYVDKDSHNPRNLNYYLYQIRRGKEVVYQGFKDTLELAASNVDFLQSYDSFDVFDAQGNQLASFLWQDGMTIQQQIRKNPMLRGVLYVLVHRANRSVGIHLRVNGD